MEYSAKVPLHLEYVSEYDTHDSSTYAECEFESEIEIKSMVCRLNYSPEGETTIFIEGIEAHDQIEVFIILSHLLPLLANAISLDSGKGHGTFVFFKSSTFYLIQLKYVYAKELWMQ